MTVLSVLIYEQRRLRFFGQNLLVRMWRPRVAEDMALPCEFLKMQDTLLMIVAGSKDSAELEEDPFSTQKIALSTHFGSCCTGCPSSGRMRFSIARQTACSESY